MADTNYIVRILDGYVNGTAIYYSAYDLFITAEQFVRTGPEVTIIDQNNHKTYAEVKYLNERLNIAFLKPTLPIKFEGHSIIEYHKILNRLESNAIGFLPHSGLKSYATTLMPTVSIVTPSTSHIFHTAKLDVACLGGPLLNEVGEIIGINTRHNYGDEYLTLALTNESIQSLIDDFFQSSYRKAVMCFGCNDIIEDKGQKYVSCPECKNRISLISNLQPFELPSINRKIEKILTILGHDAVLCRSNMNNWVINKGSARIHLQYNQNTGIIVVESFLCKLPEHNRNDVLEYLLKQNYHSRGYSFSIREDIVVLSLLIYDQFINQESAVMIFNKLFQTADLYDNILIDQFGAKWIDGN